ncbi:MBL fold metallo-hydrolase [Oscillibacter ruminantium]|uniref:MBL fold metallo-hydrolase n=1 Tax=Oscillibacter ruminantium TaxID=1263547 RepID=UPI003324279A
MKIKLLSSKNYSTDIQDYGDCILVDSGTTLVVYDCGSEAHAKRVQEYMKKRGYTTTIVVLSHDDDDHMKGIPYLLENRLVEYLYAPLFLKHLNELLDRLDDRHKREPLKEQILSYFTNITALAEQCRECKVELRDTLKASTVAENISIVGPTKEYVLDAVAKAVNKCESDTIDIETISNAISTQMSCRQEKHKALLCGDGSFEAIKDAVAEHNVIQLPHHGKLATAQSIFDARKWKNGTVYLVSDNKGTATGGSGDLPKQGYNIQNTRNGDVEYTLAALVQSGGYTGRTLGQIWR